MIRSVVGCLILNAALAVSASAQDVDEIVARYVQARGGMQRLLAVKSMRYSGTMTVAPGVEAPMTLEQKRPNLMRLEFVVQGMTGIHAYDGRTGWTIMPFMGKTEPEIMGEEDLKGAMEQADFDGPLVNFRQKGNHVELLGKETVEGKETYKLKLTLKQGGMHFTFLDAGSFLPVKDATRRVIQGKEQEFEARLGNYKRVSGLMIAHSTENVMKGINTKQKVILTKVEIDPPLDDARFLMPKVKKAPAAPETKKP